MNKFSGLHPVFKMLLFFFCIYLFAALLKHNK